MRTNTNNRDISIMLVGNKCDRVKDRAVPLEIGKSFARNNDLRYESMLKDKEYKSAKHLSIQCSSTVLWRHLP